MSGGRRADGAWQLERGLEEARDEGREGHQPLLHAVTLDRGINTSARIIPKLNCSGLHTSMLIINLSSCSFISQNCLLSAPLFKEEQVFPSARKEVAGIGSLSNVLEQNLTISRWSCYSERDGSNSYHQP